MNQPTLNPNVSTQREEPAGRLPADQRRQYQQEQNDPDANKQSLQKEIE